MIYEIITHKDIWTQQFIIVHMHSVMYNIYKNKYKIYVLYIYINFHYHLIFFIVRKDYMYYTN